MLVKKIKETRKKHAGQAVAAPSRERIIYSFISFNFFGWPGGVEQCFGLGNINRSTAVPKLALFTVSHSYFLFRFYSFFFFFFRGLVSRSVYKSRGPALPGAKIKTLRDNENCVARAELGTLPPALFLPSRSLSLYIYFLFLFITFFVSYLTLPICTVPLVYSRFTLIRTSTGALGVTVLLSPYGFSWANCVTFSRLSLEPTCVSLLFYFSCASRPLTPNRADIGRGFRKSQ